MQDRESKQARVRLKRELVERSGGRCEICGRRSRLLEIEHVAPLSEVGADSRNNLLLVCASCNARSAREPGQVELLRRELTANYALERRAVDLLTAVGFGVMSDASGPEGSVDVIAHRAHPTGEVDELLLEVKSRPRPVGVADVASFAARVGQYGYRLGIMLTNTAVAPEALALAAELAVRVVSFAEFEDLVNQLVGVHDE